MSNEIQSTKTLNEQDQTPDDSSDAKTSLDQDASMQKIDANCPDWAITMIDQLRQIEIFLGHIPKAIEWQSELLKDINKKIFAEQHGSISEDHSELLFGRISRGLHKEGFSTEEIATYINARIGYKGGPKYCSPAEVLESLN